MISDFKHLTLGKFLELRNMDLVDREDIDIQVEIISILSDMDEDTILSLPITEYSRMAQQTAFLSGMPNIGNKCPNKIILNGNEYIVLKDVREMTAGQYIDYQAYIGKGNMEENLPQIISCFLIPKGHKYADGYDVAEVIDDIKEHLSIEDALTISRFFFRQSQNSINSMLTYLEWKIRRMMRKKTIPKEKMEEALRKMDMLRNFLSVGDGLKW